MESQRTGVAMTLCPACASGYHEDPAFAFSACTCPCHGKRREEVHFTADPNTCQPSSPSKMNTSKNPGIRLIG